MKNVSFTGSSFYDKLVINHLEPKVQNLVDEILFFVAGYNLDESNEFDIIIDITDPIGKIIYLQVMRKLSQ